MAPPVALWPDGTFFADNDPARFKAVLEEMEKSRGKPLAIAAGQPVPPETPA